MSLVSVPVCEPVKLVYRSCWNVILSVSLTCNFSVVQCPFYADSYFAFWHGTLFGVPMSPEKSWNSFFNFSGRELGLSHCKNREILECGPEKASHWWSNFCDIICVKLRNWAFFGTYDEQKQFKFFAVVCELADHKQYWNGSSFTGIYSAEKSWCLVLSFEWELWLLVLYVEFVNVLLYAVFVNICL